MNNPIKPTIKTEIFPIVVILITALSSFYFYAHFPEKVPTHWNFQGEVDGWSSREVGAFLMPGIVIFLYLLFLFLPNIDPKKERYTQFQKVYHRFKNFFVLIFAALYFLAAFSGLGYNVPIARTVPFIIGLLFVFIGNYMSKIKPNWFMGIRTPWTLSNEEVWNKTHRLGGKLFMLMGVIMILMGLIPSLAITPVFVFIIILAALGPVVYSYLLYREIKK